MSWDPRGIPENAEIGHNCIASDKGKGYGNLQLKKAVCRISLEYVKRIIVTTNKDLIPAQRMYERNSFTQYHREQYQNSPEFEHIHYNLLIENHSINS